MSWLFAAVHRAAAKKRTWLRAIAGLSVQSLYFLYLYLLHLGIALAKTTSISHELYVNLGKAMGFYLGQS